jgi:hypothetical protein
MLLVGVKAAALSLDTASTPMVMDTQARCRSKNSRFFGS